MQREEDAKCCGNFEMQNVCVCVCPDVYVYVGGGVPGETNLFFLQRNVAPSLGIQSFSGSSVLM